MKKILEVLDPRKSRSTEELSSMDTSNKIAVLLPAAAAEEQKVKLFELNQLSQAIKTAAETAVKTNSNVKVLLPPKTVPVKGSITLLDNVSLVGQAHSDMDTKAEQQHTVSTLLFDSTASIVVKGKGVRISNLLLTAVKKSKANSGLIVVEPESVLEIVETVLETEKGVTAEVLGVVVSAGAELKMEACLVSNWRVVVGKGAKGSIQKTQFLNTQQEGKETKKKAETSVSAAANAAVTFVTGSEGSSLKEVEISGYSCGVFVGDTSTKVEIADVKISAQATALKVTDALVTVKGGSFMNSACLLIVKGNKAQVELTETELLHGEVGVWGADGAGLTLNSCRVKQMSSCGVKVESEASIVLNESFISGTDTDVVEEDSERGGGNGIEITRGGKMTCNTTRIVNMKGYGVLCQDEDSKIFFRELEVRNIELGGVFISDSAQIHGCKLEFSNNSARNLDVRGDNTTGLVEDMKVKGGTVAAVIAGGALCDIYKLKCLELTEKAVYISDSGATIRDAQIVHKKTNKPGICVNFKKNQHAKVLLKDCKVQNCVEGIKVIQHRTLEQEAEKKSKRESQKTVIFGGEEDPDLMDVTGGSKKIDKLSKCEIENCAFVQCTYGFYVDAARATLKGCSFIMNKTHSIYIKNQRLQTGNQLRKESNLKIRWPNYVEPYIDNGAALANNPQLLTSVTQEKAFCGSADFEPVMYLSTLTERIRQARNLFRSRDVNNVPKARVIMRSVSHMLILLKDLAGRLLDKELLDDPDLGMFAATFQLSDEKKKGMTNSLVSMEDLFNSWQSLSRTRLFDSALAALDEAFERKQVDEDLYDKWVTPLEEMQRVCFVNSKYNRRRDYLLTTAKETPLTTWYFLDKEDPSKPEGKRLRAEVLRFLAADAEEHRVHNKNGFHASWVAQWAVNLLGDDFMQDTLPLENSLRRAWADKLMDLHKPSLVLKEYKKVANQNSYTSDMDQLIKYEAIRQHERLGNKLSQEQYQSLQQMLGGEGFAGAMKAAGRLFTGEGALPGFLRRVAEEAEDAEALLEALSPVYEDSSQQNKKVKKYVVLAVIGHFLNEDSQFPPKIYERQGKRYETCPSCLVQKLQPWNELKLQRCQDNHRFCRDCIKSSMSTGVTDLWGRCPGYTNGENCEAIASRREMELSGMEKELIYNILNVRVTKHLQAIKDWKQCDAPGCIGGRANVKKDFYTCRLCTKMVTMDGGRSDPTVSKRLLIGLDGSSIARGEGIFRECFHCGVIYEKGNACSTITCSNCNKQFNMTWGPEKNTHRFDEEGVGPQRYVPKKTAQLWNLGVFKDRKGKALKLGQNLTENEAAEVVRRAKIMLATLSG